MNCENSLVNILVVTFVLVTLCDARGGRRGGSFGGLFGSWRKYKKPSSGGGNSRRVVSSSPMHTPITKAWHDNKKPINSENVQTYNQRGYNSAPLPVGGSYYHNTAALPGNAIYVPQAPPKGAEFGDFLTGYLTGRLLTMGFPLRHHHISHVYRAENPSVVENTVESTSTSSQPLIMVNGQHDVSTEGVFNTPLIAYSTSLQDFTDTEAKSTSTLSPLIFLSTTEPPTPPYGIICVPIIINKTEENGKTVENERTVCYPAPASTVAQKDMKSKPVQIAGDIMDN